MQIQKWFPKGCVLPLLFNLYSKHIFIKALENIEEGIRMNVRDIDIRSAVDTISIDDNLNIVTKTSEHYGHKPNVKKRNIWP